MWDDDDAAPDDDHLLALGAALVEPLLDCHHDEIFEEFLAEAHHNRKLRRACSGAWLRIPEDKGLLLRELVAQDGEQPPWTAPPGSLPPLAEWVLPALSDAFKATSKPPTPDGGKA